MSVTLDALKRLALAVGGKPRIELAQDSASRAQWPGSSWYLTSTSLLVGDPG
jgi:hypothetical protein